MRIFLKIYSAGANLTEACKAAQVSRSAVYHLLDRSEAFRAAFALAYREGGDILEDECFRRAVKGVEKPVYQGGHLVGLVQEYSDGMAQFMLKGRKPEVYDRQHIQEHHVTGEIDLIARLNAGRDRVARDATGDAETRRDGDAETPPV